MRFPMHAFLMFLFLTASPLELPAEQHYVSSAEEDDEDEDSDVIILEEDVDEDDDGSD